MTGQNSSQDRTSPRFFCPACVREHAGARRLCPACGSKLVLQGFCSVCEAHWLLAPGSDCPKHDIELISEPPESPMTSVPAKDTRWVHLASYARSHEAEAARIRLDAEGIPSLLDGQRMNIAYPNQLATGGTRLLVPASLVQDARILLAQSWAPPFDDEDEPELESPVIASAPRAENDAAHEPEPVPGPTSPLLWASLLAIVLLLLGALRL